MFSVLSALRSTGRCLYRSTNSSKRWLSSDLISAKELNLKNTIGLLKLSPNMITGDEVIPKTDPILDKLQTNTSDVLKKIIGDPFVVHKPIYFPNLSSEAIQRISETDPQKKPSLEMPSATTPVKMYLDYRIIRDPRRYTHLTIIRHQKMNKHKRLKWRKKMLAFIKKKFLKRNIKTEKVFRAELLAQIKEAEDFDAEKYVRNILETIDNTPKPETPKEKIERIRELIRKNRRETNLISPKFDD